MADEYIVYIKEIHHLISQLGTNIITVYSKAFLLLNGLFNFAID